MIGFAVSAFAGNSDQEKASFYSVLTTVTPSDASYTFLLDQYLEAKCGKPQSIDHIKKVSAQGASLYVILAIKSGDVAKAREVIRSLPCEALSPR